MENQTNLLASPQSSNQGNLTYFIGFMVASILLGFLFVFNFKSGYYTQRLGILIPAVLVLGYGQISQAQRLKTISYFFLLISLTLFLIMINPLGWFWMILLIPLYPIGYGMIKKGVRNWKIYIWSAVLMFVALVAIMIYLFSTVRLH